MFNCSLFLNKAKSEFETILCYSFYKIKILTSEDQPNPIYFNSPLFLFKHHFLKLFSSLLLKKNRRGKQELNLHVVCKNKCNPFDGKRRLSCWLAFSI